MMNDDTLSDCPDDRNIGNQLSVSTGSIVDDEPWSKKSLKELEQDADQLLEDIRSIVSNVECSTTAIKDVFDHSDPLEFRSFDSFTNSSSSPPVPSALECATSPPTLTEEKSPIAPNSAGDIDDDSMRGELERLDSVANAIRLSLDGKSFANLHDSTSSPLFSQAGVGSDFLVPCNASTAHTEKEAVRTKTHVPETLEQFVVYDTSYPSAVNSVTLKHANLEDKSEHWIMALCIAFLLIASLWLWTIYTMIVVSQCEVLNGEGVVRWPTCSRQIR